MLLTVLIYSTVQAQNTGQSTRNKGDDPLNGNDTTAVQLVDSLDTTSDTTVSFSDSTTITNDTLPPDSGKTVIRISKDSLDAPVTYSARDSMKYDIANKKVYLWGDAKVKYNTIEVAADHIIYDWSEGTITADVLRDSTGNPLPDKETTFKDGGDEYSADRMMYNFKTGKGKVVDARTMEGGGYIILEEAKKNEYDEWYGRRGKYTTCNLEDPHFYFEASKVKLVPEEIMVSGPANLVISDVPTPLYIPFAMYPIKQGKRSGLIMPKPGWQGQRGLSLINGGYYLGFSDYFDLALTGDVYTNGTFAVRANSRYKKRYKFGGNFFFAYGRNRLGEPESPDFNVSNDFQLRWQHTQDAKARPGVSFTANVNFGSSRYDRNFSTTAERITNSQLNSNVSFSKSWPKYNMLLSVDASHSQSLVSRVVTVTLPRLSFAVTRFQPFKAKKGGGKKRWYETIGMSYNFEAKNTVSAVDSVFFKQETLDDARFGMRHRIPISANINAFKYLTISPSINYNERWYFKTVDKSWDPTVVYDTTYNDEGGIANVDTINGQVVSDTITGFKAARDFNAAITLSTRLYGNFNFKGKRVKAMRHIMTPQLSATVTPDFGTDFWGYYKTVQNNAEGGTTEYSVFEPSRSIYGAPGNGLRAELRFSLNNRIEMKTHARNDTSKEENKFALFDNIGISTSYDFAADSLNLRPLSISAWTTIFQNTSINFSTSLDPYAVTDENVRINKFMWEDQRRFYRLTDMRFTISSSFRSKKANQRAQQQQQQSTTGAQNEQDYILSNLQNYYDWDIPWDVSVNYNLNLSKGIPGQADTLVISYNVFDVRGTFNLTPKWKVSLNTGYDFNRKDFSITSLTVVRNLHCWELRFEFTPYPQEQQRYMITLAPLSPILQQLKLTRKQERFDTVF